TADPVAGAVVGAERGPLVDLAGEGGHEGCGEFLGVAERVGDPMGGDGVAIGAGVADERPTVAPGVADEARCPRVSPDAALRQPAKPLRRLGDRAFELAVEPDVDADVPLAQETFGRGA